MSGFHSGICNLDGILSATALVPLHRGGVLASLNIRKIRLGIPDPVFRFLHLFDLNRPEELVECFVLAAIDHEVDNAVCFDGDPIR